MSFLLLVRSGETVEHWRRLITVQQFPQNDDSAGFAQTLLNLVAQRMPGETPEVFKEQDQYLLCFFLEDTALSKMEFIFQRVCKEPEVAGLKVYTFRGTLAVDLVRQTAYRPEPSEKA